MLYLHAGSPFRGELGPWIAKDSLGRNFMVDEFDMSLLDTDPRDEDRWEELLQDFQAGRYNLVLLCPPAASFNRAAFATSSGPAPVRDVRWPEGYPWLQGKQKLKAQRGTQHIRQAVQLAQSADSLHVPWLWEHPEHLGATARGTPASVWTWPETQKFFLQSQATTVVLAQCAYGGASRSPTRFAGTWVGLGSLGHPGWPKLDKEGCYRGPLPRHCGHDHSSSLPVPGYPASLCQALARLAWATVDSSPASNVGGSSFQRAGKDTSENALAASSGSLPSSDPEAVAASLHVPTKQQILDIFDMLPSDDPPRGQLQVGSKAFTVGSYAVGGGLLGVRKATRTYAELLCRFVESLKQGFEFMAVALFRDLRTLPHRDLGNQQGTCNLVAGLSGFRSGGVWVSSDSGAVPCPFEGFSECGDVLPVSGTFAIFDPRRLHCTMEWQGSRVVFVAYCPFLGKRVADADLDFLVSLGFRPPGQVCSTDRPPLERLLDDNDDAPGSSDLWGSLPSAEPDDDVAADSEAGSTSDEDEDGHPKPAYGEGKLGWGPPMRSKLMGRLRWFADGHGLASPGRWPPDRRPSGSNDRDLLLHKELMDGLLRLLSESLDVKREVCRLATGHAKASPFPPELSRAGRDLVFQKLQGAGSKEPLDRVPERQPFYLEAISELLRFAGDPDWRRYTKASWSFSAGVPLAVDVKLPRTPALFFRKTKHRKFVGAAEQLSDEPRLNYPSAREHELKIEEQFEKEISLGAMIEMPLDEARSRYGDSLSIASLGAIPKADDTVRVVHDGSNGQHVNDRIKVRDAQSTPTGADLSAALEELPRAYFSITGDISRAHRLVLVRSADWARQACRAYRKDRVYLNAVGTFGIVSASYWWYRLFSGLGRLLYYAHGQDRTTLLTYVDDLIWITESSQGLPRILASIFLLEILGIPFAWHKFRGGAEHGWIGFSISAHQRLLGISRSRADWMIGWIRKVKSDGFVNIADMGAVLGRLSFGLTVLPLLRPFLGPLYAWVAAVRHCHVLKLPKAIYMILSFLESFFLKDLRTAHVPRRGRKPIELFRTDAKAEGDEMWVGGWASCESANPYECHWFAEKISHLEAPWFHMAGQSYRSIASLELLATLIGVVVFQTAPFTHANFVCSAATDNRGNSQLTSRWLTTSFPLVAVLVELATVLQNKSLSLELHWAPRLQNSLADSLTNQDFKSFNPDLRLRFSFGDYQSLVMKEMLDLGSSLYQDIAEWKIRKRGRGDFEKGVPRSKASKLSARDPWK